VITIEDLNVKGMLKNRKLSRAISDVGFGDLRQMIKYKAQLRNYVVVIANRFFPAVKPVRVAEKSTQICHLQIEFLPAPAAA
jgi:transposase